MRSGYTLTDHVRNTTIPSALQVCASEERIKKIQKQVVKSHLKNGLFKTDPTV
jgi:hypothetical protein